MRAVPVTELAYREFQFPLNVFMHMLTLEEGSVTYLHYGLFDDPSEPIAKAQERSTELLLSRLPPSPARVLDVGAGIGTTLATLTRLGYDAIGITPDEGQVATIRARHGDAVNVVNVAFERLFPRAYDVVLFQESSQYIDAAKLFAKAREITNRVIVLDEFSTEANSTLHELGEFVRIAAAFKFRLVEDTDLSSRAAPTIDYFLERLPRYRPTLEHDLGLDPKQIDDLIGSGRQYRDRYRTGAYVYRLLRFER